MRRPWLVLLGGILMTPMTLGQPSPLNAVPADPAWLNDEANALSASARARVGSLAHAAWTRGQVRLAVTLVRDTGAATVAERARAAWESQGLGGRAVLLFVAVDARSNHIQVGDAVAGAYPEAFRQHVLREVFAPTARAEGVEAATVRTVEELHARALGQRPSGRSLGQRFDDGWTWLSRYGVFVFLGLLAVSGSFRRHRAARRSLNDRTKEFDAMTRSYRALRDRFARPDDAAATYRDAPVARPAHGDPAWLSALSARVATARDAWGSPAARLAEVDASIAALRLELSPLEELAAAGERFRSLKEDLASALRALRDELADKGDYVRRGVRAWPRESFDAARAARARAELEVEALEREITEAINRGEGLADEALLPVCKALDALCAKTRDAARDASEPRLRHEALKAAAEEIAALRTELDYKSSEAIAASRPGTLAADVARHQRCLEEATALRDKEMIPFAAALRRLHSARKTILDGPPTHATGSRVTDGLFGRSDPFWTDRNGGGSSGGSSGTSGSW